MNSKTALREEMKATGEARTRKPSVEKAKDRSSHTPLAHVLRRAFNAHPSSLGASDLKRLQQSIGNRAVGQLLMSSGRNSLGAQPILRQPIQAAAETRTGREVASSGASSFHSAVPVEVKAKAEAVLGADLSHVTIRANSIKASAIGAAAFTQGSDIHFAPGRFRTDSRAGQALLGHELTHVVQQREGRVAPTRQASGFLLNESQDLETEANRAGRRIAGAAGAGGADNFTAHLRARGSVAVGHNAPAQKAVSEREVIQASFDAVYVSADDKDVNDEGATFYQRYRWRDKDTPVARIYSQQEVEDNPDEFYIAGGVFPNDPHQQLYIKVSDLDKLYEDKVDVYKGSAGRLRGPIELKTTDISATIGRTLDNAWKTVKPKTPAPRKGNPFGRFDETVPVAVVYNTYLDEKRKQELSALHNENNSFLKYLIEAKEVAPYGFPEETQLAQKSWKRQWMSVVGNFAVYEEPGGVVAPVIGKKPDELTEDDVKQADPIVNAGKSDALKTTLNKSTLRVWHGKKRTPQQKEVMKSSASQVAVKIGLTEEASYEWLHMIAHAMGGPKGTGPQHADNLVVGTDAANTYMIIVEDMVENQINTNRVDKAKVEVTRTPIHNRSWLAKNIRYKVEMFAANEEKLGSINYDFDPFATRPPSLAAHMAEGFNDMAKSKEALSDVRELIVSRPVERPISLVPQFELQNQLATLSSQANTTTLAQIPLQLSRLQAQIPLKQGVQIKFNFSNGLSAMLHMDRNRFGFNLQMPKAPVSQITESKDKSKKRRATTDLEATTQDLGTVDLSKKKQKPLSLVSVETTTAPLDQFNFFLLQQNVQLNLQNLQFNFLSAPQLNLLPPPPQPQTQSSSVKIEEMND
jgi:hypothetical protein